MGSFRGTFLHYRRFDAGIESDGSGSENEGASFKVPRLGISSLPGVSRRTPPNVLNQNVLTARAVSVHDKTTLGQ